MHAAYISPPGFNRLTELTAAFQGKDEEQRRSICLDIMSLHASTRERLPFIEELYRGLKELLGAFSVICDLACGLHPLALPWMGLPAAVRYTAVETDLRFLDAIDAFSSTQGRPVETVCADIMSRPPIDADVTLLLKTIPCLERQEKGIALTLVEAIQSPVVVISFPNRSLGGRDKGMVRHYRSMAESIAGSTRRRLSCLSIPTETFYVLRRDS